MSLIDDIRLGRLIEVKLLQSRWVLLSAFTHWAKMTYVRGFDSRDPQGAVLLGTIMVLRVKLTKLKLLHFVKGVLVDCFLVRYDLVIRDIDVTT